MVRNKIEHFLLKITRIYTFYTPISRGKHRAYLFTLKLCKSLPNRILAKTKDGRKFSINWNSRMQTTVYFLGEYEKAITEIVKILLREGDICLDVGANFGWYATLFYKYCGNSSEIHAFEPMPPSFEELKITYQLMGSPPNVFINKVAVGEKEEELNINLFEEMPTGHASFSNQGQEDAITFKCRVVTLDSYIKRENVGNINFIKVDIEGAEKLFQQKIPPIFLMEMALNQTKNFGYLPNDLIEFMRGKADYDFYKIDEIKAKLVKIDGFDKEDIGANVLCFPRGFYQDRFASLQPYL